MIKVKGDDLDLQFGNGVFALRQRHIVRPDADDDVAPFFERASEAVFIHPSVHAAAVREERTVLAHQGENLREHTWCVIEEIPNGAWGIGGRYQTADDIRALASG